MLDRAEQIAALIVYCFLVQRIWPDNFQFDALAPIMLLISEGAVILFLLIRRPTENISTRPIDWMAATAGTFLVLMVGNGGEPVAGEFAVLLIFYGMVVHIFAKFSLRRSFGLVAANRGVRRGGMYAFIRHPMYSGYMLTHVGFMLYAPSLWNMIIYGAVWGLLIARIIFEERVLMEDETYRDYATKVRFRLAPFVY